MKKVKLFLLCLCTVLCNAQDIGGSWQLNSAKYASRQSYYEFYEDNNFEYRPDRYNGLSKIFAIGGKYQVKQDSIYFTVKYMGEVTGYMSKVANIMRRPTITDNRLEMEQYFDADDSAHYRSVPSTSNYWELTNYTTQRITFENPERWAASFKYYRDELGQEIIEIDGDKYYYIPGEEDFGEEAEEKKE
jgi:hypothetical protein